MMGTLSEQRQPEFFSYRIDLERRVRADHPLRQIKAALDLSFVIPLVKDRYGRCGHTSLDPRVIVKLMFLLFYYNIPSERELMAQLPERLDMLWFLDFDLESETPHHSVLSKARTRWGTEVFEALFVRTVEQCVRAGLVDGRLLHADSTTLKANASKDSVLKSSPELVQALRKAYQNEQRKLEVLPEPEPSSQSALEANSEPPNPKSAVNQTHISRSDPQAELARTKTGVTDLSYKEHRMVDDAHGVITAITTTPSSVSDGSQLAGLLEQHQSTTDLKLASVTVAGDHHYGTASNYLHCAEKDIRAHMAPMSAQLKARGKIPVEQFIYEPEADRLRCPAGHYLLFHQHRAKEQLKVYLIEDARLCAQCPLRKDCTESERGRSLKRHVQSQRLDELRAEARSVAASYSRKRRRHVMEGSFANAANNHRTKRSRWRGLWKQHIQGWIIAAVQNLRLLVRNGSHKPNQAAVNLQIELSSVQKALKTLAVCLFRWSQRPGSAAPMTLS